MRRPRGRRAGAAIVRAGRADLARAVRQLRHSRHAFGQRWSPRRNVPQHPVQHVVGAVADRRHPTSCTISTKLATPSGTLLQLSGGETSSPACVYFARNLAAVGPRRRRQRHHLDRRRVRGRRRADPPGRVGRVGAGWQVGRAALLADRPASSTSATSANVVVTAWRIVRSTLLERRGLRLAPRVVAHAQRLHRIQVLAVA